MKKNPKLPAVNYYQINQALRSLSGLGDLVYLGSTMKTVSDNIQRLYNEDFINVPKPTSLEVGDYELEVVDKKLPVFNLLLLSSKINPILELVEEIPDATFLVVDIALPAKKGLFFVWGDDDYEKAYSSLMNIYKPNKNSFLLYSKVEGTGIFAAPVFDFIK